MASSERLVEELLVERGLLKPEQLAAARQRAEQANVNVLDILQVEKMINPEALAQLQAERLGLPYIDLTKIKPSKKVMRDVSRQAAASYRFVPFDEQEGKLLVAVETPENFQALQAIRFIARKRGLEPVLHLASRESIDLVLGITAEIQAEIGGAIREFSREIEATGVRGKDDREVQHLIQEAPVSKVVAVIIKHAIEGAASDIHIEPGEHELKVRYRVDGRLHTSLLLPIKIHAAVISRIKILSNLKIDESRLPQDGRFSTTAEGRSYDFRVATMPIAFGEKAVLRILAKSQGPPTFDQLGLWEQHQNVFLEHLKLPNGIILISGPTGSGKSTTLFTALTLLNAPEVNIVTLEDPIEYEVEGVNQTQIHSEIGLTFASGLRSLLRQDPNILMVGEIRDKDTAELAVHAALTGHLVLSTIHTNDAVGVIPRLVDMGIDPFLLTATVRLLMAQRLVVKLCENCRKKVEIPEALRLKLVKAMQSIPAAQKTDPNQRDPKFLFESPGCQVCHNGSSLGRLAIFEMVPVSKAVRAVINESPEYDTLEAVARRENNLNMQQDGLLKALAGHVQYEDVMRVTKEEEGKP